GDFLTINSPFAASGASSLSIDTDGLTADRLIINGAGTGTTTTNVTALPGLVFNPAGVLVVDTTAATGTFTLGSTVGNGLIDLSLLRNGTDVFLISLPNANAFQPTTYMNIGLDMWYQSKDIVDNYLALKRSDLAPGAVPLGVWGQIYWSRDRYGDDDNVHNVFGNDVVINEHLRTKRRGIQAGVDYNFGPGVVGVTAGWQRADAEISSGINEVDGKCSNSGAYRLFSPATS